jgi:hypothetical protein
MEQERMQKIQAEKYEKLKLKSKDKKTMEKEKKQIHVWKMCKKKKFYIFLGCLYG